MAIGKQPVTCRKVLVEYGIPEEVLSDNGQQFTSRFLHPRPTEVLFERILADELRGRSQGGQVSAVRRFRLKQLAGHRPQLSIAARLSAQRGLTKPRGRRPARAIWPGQRGGRNAEEEGLFLAFVRDVTVGQPPKAESDEWRIGASTKAPHTARPERRAWR
jgi:hypothetical protein